MKKLLSFALCILLFVVCAMFVTYRVLNTAPSSDLTSDMQVKEIVESGQCLVCHSQNPDLPFYSTWPVIGDQVQEDARLAVMEHDFTDFYNALSNDLPVDIVSLNKLEKTIQEGTMPLKKFYLVHWGSAINCDEKAMVLRWAKETRLQMPYFDLLGENMQGEPICPIPDAVDYDAVKAGIGETLYFDPILSVDSTVSCATCHDLAKGGTDNLQFSKGVKDLVGGVNAPTVFNSTFNFVQFWDGRAATLALQAAGPPTNPIEMGWASWRDIEAKMKLDPFYSEIFGETGVEGVYAELTEANVTDAIEHYERTLLTPNSPFDLYLKGDEDAMDDRAKNGYDLFKRFECATCHGGVNMGGQSYEFMGLKEDYFAARGTEILEEDKGRAKQDTNAYFMHRFKTPGLRNVALTAPYFHDGTQKTLEDAVVAMLRFQIGETLDESEVDDMVGFMNQLTGEVPQRK